MHYINDELVSGLQNVDEAEKRRQRRSGCNEMVGEVPSWSWSSVHDSLDLSLDSSVSMVYVA